MCHPICVCNDYKPKISVIYFLDFKLIYNQYYTLRNYVCTKIISGKIKQVLNKIFVCGIEWSKQFCVAWNQLKVTGNVILRSMWTMSGVCTCQGKILYPCLPYRFILKKYYITWDFFKIKNTIGEIYIL